MRPTPEQFAHLYSLLRPSLGRLSRLRSRLIVLGYPPDDPYLVAVSKAWAALHELCVQTHYLSCSGGVAGANRPAQSKDKNVV